MQRIDQYLNVLEERSTALLSNIDFDSMTPYQRVQAACHLLTLTMRMLKLRQDYIPPDDHQSQLDAIMKDLIEYGLDGKKVQSYISTSETFATLPLPPQT